MADEHLYAATILGPAACALVVWLVPVRYAADVPDALQGMAAPWGIALPAAATLAVISYRQRTPAPASTLRSIDVCIWGALSLVAGMPALAA